MSDEIDKAQKINLRKRKRLREDYRAVFGTDVGRRVMRDLHKVCVLDNVGFIQKETALHSQGRRWVYVRIHKLINMGDDDLDRLMKEES